MVGAIVVYSFRLAEQEQIIKKDHANLYCDGQAFAGAFYLTSERLVFVGYLLDINEKYIEDVQLAHIADVVPGKTFYFIPNVLSITTIRDRKLKFIVNGRNEWLLSINEQLKLIK